MSDRVSSETGSPQYSTDDCIRMAREANLHAVADSMEYLRQHVEEFENGDIDVGEFPLDHDDELAFRLAVNFGIYWEQEVPHDRD